jgi:periplasmic protein CpxP/Spy
MQGKIGGVKMKAGKAIRLGAVFAALLTLAAAAGAQAPPASGGGFGAGLRQGPGDEGFGALRGRFWNNPKIVDALKLTDDQRKAMDDILQQHLETLVDLRANAEKAELALRPLINADQLDESRILAQIDQVAQARAELFKANARFLLAIRSKLTPDQWKQIQQFRDEHPQMMQRWRQRQGGQGPQNQAPPPDNQQ